jgi:DNA-binding beta-propeller fold protein YncE
MMDLRIAPSTRLLPAVALGAAAGVHFGVIGEHLSEHPATGLFFLVLAPAQLAAAALVALRPSRASMLSAAAAALLPLAAWGLSRTVGLPPTGQEPVGFLDGLATALEAAALLGVLASERRTRDGGRTAPIRAPRVAMAVSSVGAAALATAVLAFPLGHTGHQAHGSHLPEPIARAAGSLGAHPHQRGAPALDRRPAVPPRMSPDGTRLETGNGPVAVALGELLWVANRGDGTVHRLHPATGSRAGPPIPVGSHPAGVALGAGSAWVTSYSDDTVTRIDLHTGRILGVTRVGRLPVGVATASGSVWVVNSGEGSVTRIDARSGRVITRRIEVGPGPLGIAAGLGSVWVTSTLHRHVVAIDPRTGRVGAQIEVGGGAVGIDTGAGAVWVANASEGTVSRIDPLTGSSTAYPVDGGAGFGRGPIGIAAGPGGVWVANNRDKTLVRLDPMTGAPDPPRYLSARTAGYQGLMGVVVGLGAVWATEYESDALVRVPARG